MVQEDKGMDKLMDLIEYYGLKHEVILPDGYIFTDENGNVINATKIVLEKKEKEYPKTYVECCKIMGIDKRFLLTYNLDFWKGRLLTSLQKLLICRDAYWKIAGEKMGLVKPWKPDWENGTKSKYCICNNSGDIGKISLIFNNAILSFPTEKMRDAFYENFKEFIEQCKELL